MRKLGYVIYIFLTCKKWYGKLEIAAALELIVEVFVWLIDRPVDGVRVPVFDWFVQNGRLTAQGAKDLTRVVVIGGGYLNHRITTEWAVYTLVPYKWLCDGNPFGFYGWKITREMKKNIFMLPVTTVIVPLPVSGLHQKQNGLSRKHYGEKLYYCNL